MGESGKDVPADDVPAPIVYTAFPSSGYSTQSKSITVASGNNLGVAPQVTTRSSACTEASEGWAPSRSNSNLMAACKESASERTNG